MIKSWQSIGRCPPEQNIWRLAAQLTLALHLCHCGLEGQPVLHRDVKPSNILFDGNKNARLADFGLSHVYGTPALFAQTNPIGTPYYMPPEQVTGRKSFPASDIWSLGCVLHEASTLRRPFDTNKGIEELNAKILKGVPDKPLPPVYAEELKEIISSMMQCDYLARPSTMDLLAREELKAHLSPQDLAEAARLTEMQRSTNERIEAVERAEKEARELKEREEMEALLAAEAEKAEKARLADEWVAAQERERDEAQRRKEEDVALGEERRVLAERERIARELAEKEKQEQAASQREEMRAEGSADLSRRERQLENREKELEELMASLRESGANLPTEYEGRASSRSPSRGYRSRSRGRSRPRARPGKWAPITDEPNDSESVPLLNGLLLAQNMPLDNVLRLLHKVEANVRRMQHESGNEFTLNFGPEGFFMG